MRIVINCALNHIKKSKKIVYIENYDSKSSYDHLKDTELKMDLRKAMGNLDSKYKIVVILKYFEDMTFEEISQIVNLPLSTVKTQLYRALRQLKIDIEEV